MSNIGKWYYGAKFVTDGGGDTEYVMGDGTLSDGTGLNTTIGTDADLTTSGALVVDDIVLTDGVVISHSTRTLTLANLGYTGATNANNYVHPTHPGDDMSIDTGALTGAVIVSDIDLNVTTDTLGHVTDANATVATRTLTLANLGYTGATDANKYVHPGYATTNINTSGAVIVDSITTNSTGHITGMGTRTLTLANLGYTGSGITASNGLTETGGDIELGGSLSSATLINTASDSLSIYNSSSGGLIQAKGSAAHSSGFGSATFGFGDSSGFLEEGFSAFSDKFEFVSDSGKGIEYDADYSSTYTTRSLVDKAYVDGEVYNHPTHPGDDINIDTTALTGAVVISDLDLNVTTDTLGHVTDANATVATRTLTLANLGYTGATNANNYVHPTYNGDDFSIDTTALTGAVVISDLDINITTDTSGHVVDANATVGTRTLTLANLGYTGATDANNYVLPTNLAGDDFSIDTTALTGATVISDLDINITTDTSGRVTDANGTVATRELTLGDLGYTGDTNANNTTARTDEEIRDVAAAQWVNGTNTTVVFDDASNTIKINAPAGGVVDGSGVANYMVKWTDSDTLTDSILHEVNDRVGINVIQTNATFAISKTGDETMLFEPNVSNGGKNQLNNLNMSTAAYVGMIYNALSHEFKTSGTTKVTIASTGAMTSTNTITATSLIKTGGTSSQFLMADGSVTTGGSSGIDGSGTAKFIPRFSDSDTLTDSTIFEDNDGNILINSSTIGDGALNVYQTTTDPTLHLVTDDAGASAGPIIKMERDSSSPADDDLLGRIEFVGKDSNGGDVVYGQMQGYIYDTTVGSGLRGGFKLQGFQASTMFTNLETVGSRGFLHNDWFVKDDIVIEGTGTINIDSGATLLLNSSNGTAGQVLSSNGSSSPTWINTVHSNTSEGGTGSVNIGNMVKITAAAHSALGAGADADTLYIIVG